MLNPSTHFSPIRMEAYVRNEVEMELSVKNDGGTPRWVEADIEVPGAVSLAPDRSLAKARVRVGIALMGEKISKKIKVYGGAGSYPDTYTIRLTFYGYDKEGTIVERTEFKSELRCERAGYG